MRHPLLLMTATFIVWSIAFLALYATQATGCRLTDGANTSTLVLRIVLSGLATLSIAAVAASAWLTWRMRLAHVSDSDRFLRTICNGVSIAAIVAAFFCFSGVFWLTLC